MKISRAELARVLLDEGASASEENIDVGWQARFISFSEMCREESRTHIAYLGTAILAKSVNTRADAFSVKRRTGRGALPGAYSARGVVAVLAQHAKELGMNIGVTGREPLNNQPYFGIDRLTRSVVVREGSREALLALCDILDDVQDVESEDVARKILRTYIHVRRTFNPAYALLGKAASTAPSDLVALITGFVSANGEGGKRAQAVAAGLLDVCSGDKRVVTARINDPDRGFPGDIGLRESSKSPQPEKVIEVRDKPVSETDVDHFLSKVSRAGVHDAAMLAVAVAQSALDEMSVHATAAASGIFFRVFVGWRSFVEEVFFWSELPHRDAVKLAAERIYLRLVEFEVSPAGVADWVARMGAADSSGAAASAA